MLGLTGIVIKSHGSADVLSYTNAIEIAILEVEKSVPEHIRECMDAVVETEVDSDMPVSMDVQKKSEAESQLEKQA